MAQLNSRGTQTRGRWDYFERSNALAAVWGNVASGPIAAYFVNNSTGAAALDVYTFSWYASVAIPWTIALLLPPIAGSAITPTETHIYSLQPDHAVPAGLVGMYTLLSSPAATITRVSNSMQGQQFAPIMGSFFLTLPPGWGLSVGGIPPSGPCEMSLTVWYQEVLDNIAPAV